MQPNASTETVLPRAVRMQVKSMQERIDARTAPAPASDPAALPTDAAALTTPAANDPPQPASDPAAAPAAPAPSATPASAADARENSVDYWRDRFKVMQGINDKLRRDHEGALEARDRQLAELNARVAELETAGPRNPNAPPDIKLFFTPEQIDRFGEEQCSAMAAAAMTAASDQAQRIVEAEVAPIRQRTQADDAARARTAQDAFWSKLDELIAKIPEAGNRTIWEINEEPGWLAWLNEADANGEQRQKHLTRHQRELNAQGVANLVGEYLRKLLPKTPTPPVTPGGGAGNGSDPPQGQAVNGKGYPSPDEYRDFTRRAATVRNPRDPRYVTQQERQEMEARLKLRSGGGR